GNALTFARHASMRTRLTGAIYNGVNATAVANTTSATSIFAGASALTGQSLTIPGGTVAAGQTIRIHMQGSWAVTGTPTLQITMKLNSTTIAQSAATALAVTGAWWRSQFPSEIAIISTGASGSVLAYGNVSLYSTTPTSFGVAAYPGTGGTPSGTPVTIDWTIDQTIDITATWSVASSSN